MSTSKCNNSQKLTTKLKKLQIVMRQFVIVLLCNWVIPWPWLVHTWIWFQFVYIRCFFVCYCFLHMSNIYFGCALFVCKVLWSVFLGQHHVTQWSVSLALWSHGQLRRSSFHSIHSYITHTPSLTILIPHNAYNHSLYPQCNSMLAQMFSMLLL